MPQDIQCVFDNGEVDTSYGLRKGLAAASLLEPWLLWLELDDDVIRLTNFCMLALLLRFGRGGVKIVGSRTFEEERILGDDGNGGNDDDKGIIFVDAGVDAPSISSVSPGSEGLDMEEDNDESVINVSLNPA